MTAPSNVASLPARPGRSLLSTAAIVVVGSGLVLLLAIVGITFVALAVAFPVAVPLIQDQHLPVSAADLELAKTFASAWWAFAVVGVVTLIASVVAAVKLVQHFDPAPAE